MGGKSYAVLEETVGDALVMRASGKFDREAGAEVEARLARPARAYVLNLAAVEYISSSGVAFLAKLSAGRGLRVVCLSQPVRDTLSLAGIERILKIYDDEAQACAAEGGS